MALPQGSGFPLYLLQKKQKDAASIPNAKKSTVSSKQLAIKKTNSKKSLENIREFVAK